MDRFDEVVNELVEFFKLCDGCKPLLDLYMDLIKLYDNLLIKSISDMDRLLSLSDKDIDSLLSISDNISLSDIDNKLSISLSDDKPGVYAIYLRDEGGCRLLYIEETSSLLKRFTQFVSFNHTFSWRLFMRLLEEELGRSVKSSEVLKLWEDSSLRRKIVEKIEDLFKKTCVKWKTMEGVNVNERRQIEKELINILKPLMPHIKSRTSILKNIFKGGP